MWNLSPKFFHALSSLFSISNDDILFLRAMTNDLEPMDRMKKSKISDEFKLRYISVKTQIQGLFGSSQPALFRGKFYVGTLIEPSESWIYSMRTFAQHLGKVNLFGLVGGQVKELRLRVQSLGEDRIFLIPDAQVIGGSGLVILNDEKLFWRQSRFSSNLDGLYPNDSHLLAHNKEIAVCRIPVQVDNVQVFKRAISLLDSNSASFGHFALGLVPQLRCVGLEAFDFQDCIVLVDAHLPTPFIEFLRSTFPPLVIKEIARGEVVKVKELIVPESHKYFPDHINPKAGHAWEERSLSTGELEFLFSKPTVLRPNSGFQEKLLLFRAGTAESDRRHVKNILAIKKFFQRRGFIDVSHLYKAPGDLHGRLLGATHIVTDDGSINLNLVLAGVTEKQVMVFVGPDMDDFQQSGVPGILAAFGNKVIVVKGDCKPPVNQFKNWWIDLKEVVKFIEESKWDEQCNLRS